MRLVIGGFGFLFAVAAVVGFFQALIHQSLGDLITAVVFALATWGLSRLWQRRFPAPQESKDNG
jgi:asparagine N-glycosylation enzyme membrane subunit Stt3